MGKDELVWELFERHYVEFAGRLESLAQAETTARGKLAAMIRGFCHAHDEDPTLFRFLLFVQHGQLEQAARGIADAGRCGPRRDRAAASRRRRFPRSIPISPRRSSSASCCSRSRSPPTDGCRPHGFDE